MKQRTTIVCIVLIGTTAILSGGLTGCDTGGGGRITQLLPEVVVWGDPNPDNDSTYWSIRDVNNAFDRFAVIGTGGEVEFSNGKVCNTCDVEGSTILIDGTPRVNLRFGTGPDGGDERRPFLVSIDGYYVELVSDGDVIMFQEEEERFEEDDDPSDDLAERVSTMPNPTLEQ